ncbi:tRNA uridine(34) 5-carboxymethylaminomethyl modification radical SAM/GNAT enzyme Elp3 [Candidatus Micrarchaeota archaeon]|nr:tRNA uridine(34) 5-carboxymethylaminomethyl modification radical SAM/GNAT enzyme Elp3 [Candidatus Micrarchaeota archaeon]
MDAKKKAAAYIISQLKLGRTDLDSLKREASLKFKMHGFFKNTEIIELITIKKIPKRLLILLKRKPMRTASGVAPIAVMIPPKNSCPFSCIYCPESKKAPKSYTGFEPAALRARSNKFNPYKQVCSRLRQFELNGHPTDKCDVIVMGGTFLSKPKKSKTHFIKGIYDALNGKISSSLEKAKKLNESAAHRMVGLTIETRPDVCGKKEIEEMLSYGTTKVELGVQHPSNSIYRKICRGHSVSQVVQATKLLKDAGLKVCFHIMLGLPGSSPKKDLAMLKTLFSNSDFKPDMLKIYPTIVLPGTKLFSLMKKSKYSPYSTSQAAEIIFKAYKFIPKYVRVMRIQRDIPVNLTAAGVDKSNIREIVESKLRSSKIPVQEIRFREAGLTKTEIKNPEFKQMKYDASNATEYFLSIEDNNALAAFLRLHIGKKAIIRELHVFGEETKLGKKGKVQHRGFGSLLLKEAEKISSLLGIKKLYIISAIGVKQYYLKRGYNYDGFYMSKTFNQ